MTARLIPGAVFFPLWRWGHWHRELQGPLPRHGVVKLPVSRKLMALRDCACGFNQITIPQALCGGRLCISGTACQKRNITLHQILARHCNKGGNFQILCRGVQDHGIIIKEHSIGIAFSFRGMELTLRFSPCFFHALYPPGAALAICSGSFSSCITPIIPTLSLPDNNRVWAFAAQYFQI